MAKRITIEMVAQKAGVSRGTVDRVINQRPHVRKDQYDKVMEAIRELGYIPKKRQAQALGIAITEKLVCRLGVVMPTRNPYYMNEVKQGIHDAQAQLVDYGVEIITEQISASPYPEEIAELMERIIARGADGMAICAMDCEQAAKKIDHLQEQGVPVITFDSDIRSGRMLFYGNDSSKTGRVAGQLMAKYVKPDRHIIVGVGNKEIPGHMSRADAFIDTMKAAGFPDRNLILIETYDDYTLTYKKVREALLADGDIAGIYMASHNLTGCMDAVRSTGKETSPIVIYTDMNERVYRYLKSGELAFCVTPNIYMMVYRTLIILKEYLIDHKVPPAREIFTDIQIVCKENADV